MLHIKKIKKTPEANGFSKKANWSPLKRKLGLFLFCLLVGGMGLLSLMTFKNLNKPQFINHENFIPVFFHQASRATNEMINEKDFRRLETVRNFLDSLKCHDSTRFTQLIILQPELLKNIQLLESIYQSQKK